MLRVKDVRGGGVINDNSFPQVTSNLGEILMGINTIPLIAEICITDFNVVSLVVIAAFAEKPMMYDVVNV